MMQIIFQTIYVDHNHFGAISFRPERIIKILRSLQEILEREIESWKKVDKQGDP